MNTTNAIRIHELGGPEVLRWEEVALPDPGPGEVLVRHEAIGLNYIDTYHRSGLYPVPSLPTAIGMEGAGVVEALPKVTIMPNRLRHSIEPSKVALPTPSKTTGTPAPPVMSRTPSTKSSSL